MSAALEAKLGEALSRRAELLRSLDALRLFDGSGDGAPGLVVDKFGSVAVAHSFPGVMISRAFLDELAARTPVKTIYERRHEENPRGASEREPALLFGDPVEEITVCEGRVSYLVRPHRNVNSGLFLDTRELRSRIIERSSEKRVLNTFCFTGTLGAAAIAGGAKEVTQVDISKSALTWARENYEVNRALGTGSMRFIPEDARAFLKREARRLEKGREPYDLVILDPPAFGSSAGKAFSLEKEALDLAAAAVAVLGPRGSLVFSANVRDVSEERISGAVREAAHLAGRTIGEIEPLRRPADFRASPQESSVMRGVWVSFA